ncbi:MAG: sulfite exporter TauE/SafE family protein, partial [Planctomycetota bacterium]
MLRILQKPLRFFGLWLIAFYAIWFVMVAGGEYWAEVSARWPIATGMLLGSYVAGSTPMGGGTVGFPVLVLLLDFPATIGRSFGLAIQSIGMVSATIFLLCRRQPIAWFLLRPAMIGATVGMPLGLYAIAPLIGDSAIKLVFAVVWCSFGILLIRRRQEFERDAERPIIDEYSGRIATLYGIAAGVTGGVLAAITGVGIDMILYAVLTLRFGVDLKVSIPTSVVAMAFASVVGTFCLAMNPTTGNGGLPDEVFYSWLAAAPVVALGAPLGSWVV